MFTPFSSLAGGLLIGVAASMLLLSGRVAGISGVVGAALRPGTRDRGWRLWFLGGLLATGTLLSVAAPGAFEPGALVPLPLLVAAGLLVGLGTRIGGGCTSGHGVCGIGRGSPASLLATVVFMTTGAAAVFVVRHLVHGVGL